MAREVKVYESGDGYLRLQSAGGCWRIEGDPSMRNGIGDMERASIGESGAFNMSRYMSHCQERDHSVPHGTVVASTDDHGITTVRTFDMGEAARNYFGIPL